jgi:alcohol dehydrogenase (cytochrome c)
MGVASMKRLLIVLAALALAAPAGAAPLDKLRPVSPAMLHNPAPGDWLQWGRTYDGQNFSPLKAINRGNVKTLAPAWRAPLEPGPSMPTPLVHDGVMFLQTTPDTVLALDAATGAVLWRHAYASTIPSSQKMGLALSGGRVFVPTTDLHVIALDARTGAPAWDHDIGIAPPAKDRKLFNLRSAPLIVGDKVIQGVTASGAPGGGFIVALDLATGREVWRFHTIARPGEPGGDSWNGLPLEKRSGASVWDQGSYEPALNLVYYGVGQTYDTGPLLHPSGVPGTTQESLYTDSTVALDPNTGKLVWHYQHLANDQWDLDWVFERQLVMLRTGGQTRRVVMTIGKMGLLDALDAKTGAYLFSIDAGTQNVISAIDPMTGAKTVDPVRVPDPKKSTLICPSVSGARSWPATSFSPGTGLLYVPITQWCHTFGPTGYKLLSSGVGLTGAEHPDATKSGMMGRLQAMDLAGRKLGWRHEQEAPVSSSVLATAGGVVFAGDLDPALQAFDDRDGKLLWRAPLNNYPSSSVITYAVGSTQYVAVVTGLRNNHINDLMRTYQTFRRARGPSADLPTGAPAVVVFALGKPARGSR